jgi:urate oxidase
MLDVFCHNYSPSVQKTLYEMAESVLNACPEIDMISLNMPNQHHLLADIGKLDLENNNEVFVPTGEPFGVISATVSREEE